jgi:cytochrome P450
VRARAGRTRIAYLKGADPIDDLLIRRADQLIKVNSITTPRLRRERFSSLGRLLSSDDRAEHLPTRKALAPRFSSAASASGLAEVVAGLVAELVESLARAGTSDAAELTAPFAVEVIARTVFSGIEFDAQGANTDITEVLAYERLFQPGNVTSTPAAEEAVGRVMATFLGIAEADSPEASVPAIVKRVAADLDLDEVVAARNILVVYAAGTETTAPALTFALAHLAHDRELQEWVHEECRAVLGDAPPGAADVDRLPRARAVFAEVLRLYPPSWYIARAAAEDVEVGQKTLTAGEVGLICQYHLHRDERFFRRPLEFRPSRFLEDEIPRRTYLPFGAGRRQCLGEKLAWTEGTLLVAACGPGRSRPSSPTGRSSSAHGAAPADTSARAAVSGGRRGRADDPELQGGAEPVGYAPVLDHAPLRNPDDVEHVGANRAAGRRVAHEGAVVRAGSNHPEPDGVAVHDQVLDGQVEIGERPPQRCDHGLHALSAGSVVGAEVLVLDQIG